MQKYLDLNNVDNLLEMLGLRTKSNLLNFFSLDPNLRAEIDALDVNKQSFSADMFYDFFSAFLCKERQIANINYQAIIQNSAPINIYAMHPSSNRADNYIADSLLLDHQVSTPNRSLSKPATESKLRGDSERRTGVDTQAHEDSSTESTKQVASADGFGMRSNVNFKIAKDIHSTQQMLEQAIKTLQNYKESGLQTNLLNSIAIYAGDYPIPTSCSTLLCQGRFFALNVGEKYPLFYYVDMVVHEVAHQYLQVINYLEPLSTGSNRKFLSASNNKLRPVYGIINSSFVLYRLIIFYQSAEKLLCELEEKPGCKDANAYLQTRFFQIPCNYALRLEVYKLKLKHSLKQLQGSQALTKKGSELVKIMLTELNF